MALFSEEHLVQQKQIHEDCPAYGQTSIIFAPMVSELIDSNNVSQLLDYGSGQGLLKESLDTQNSVDVRLYDPAIEAYSAAPEPAEMVTCIDVLDNVEQAHIDDVLDDLKRVVKRVGFFAINTEIPEGQETIGSARSLFPPEWWLPKLLERFELHYFSRINFGFVVVVKAKQEH